MIALLGLPIITGVAAAVDASTRNHDSTQWADTKTLELLDEIFFKAESTQKKTEK